MVKIYPVILNTKQNVFLGWILTSTVFNDRHVYFVCKEKTPEIPTFNALETTKFRQISFEVKRQNFYYGGQELGGGTILLCSYSQIGKLDELDCFVRFNMESLKNGPY